MSVTFKINIDIYMVWEAARIVIKSPGFGTRETLV